VIQWASSDLIEEYETTVRERDQLIENLIRSEEKYRKLFEDSLDAMSLTTGGIILNVNPAWLKIHGYEHKGEVVGKEVINIIHPEDRRLLSARRKNWPNIPDRVFSLRDLRHDSTFIDVEVYAFEIVIDKQLLILGLRHSHISQFTAVRVIFLDSL